MADWTGLEHELNAWAHAGLKATLWWRDDDAIDATPALEQLLALHERTGAPLALAVIPAMAKPALAARLAPLARVHVLQHGWSHSNHASATTKKTELGDHRPPDTVLDELARGWTVLLEMFGAQALPVLVPPWNRIGPQVAAGLHGRGYQGLSVFKARHASVDAPGLICCNTHVDIIDWRGTRGFRGQGDVLAQAIAHLHARRTGDAERGEPTGLITHHLVHDQGCWDFIEAFQRRTKAHGAVRWLAAPQVFDPDSA